MNYYNEFDPKAAAWLRQLIAEGLIPNGKVDERSITDVQPGDLRGFTQCHFFAGIGGWPLALRLAGWPEDREVWTGSCPCQPFSVAGNGMGEADPRHLWPDFRNLIGQCRPAIVFGEADAQCSERRPPTIGRNVINGNDAPWQEAPSRHRADCETCRMENPNPRGRTAGSSIEAPSPANVFAGLSSSGTGGLVFPNSAGDAGRPAAAPARHRDTAESASSIGAWDRFDILPFRDGKFRRVEAGTFPLAHGVPGRVGLLRGYGNAIVPQLAAEFITAYVETLI